MKRGMAIIGRMVLFCMGLLSALMVSCDSELEVQQSYPFSVETMPVPKELEKNETAEK